jgi:Mrp family chromosome partitioning ATPase
VPHATAGPSRVEVVDTPRTVPAQLPAVPTDFTGRASQVGTLLEALTPTEVGVPTVVISDKGGAGKSTLASVVAHRLAERNPDGQLYVQLRWAPPTRTGRGPGYWRRPAGTAARRVPRRT